VEPIVEKVFATYRFIPAITETTAITVITPMITPIKVKIERSLLAFREVKAIQILSRNCIMFLPSIVSQPFRVDFSASLPGQGDGSAFCGIIKAKALSYLSVVQQ
jgi:hypothetical protein